MISMANTIFSYLILFCPFSTVLTDVPVLRTDLPFQFIWVFCNVLTPLTPLEAHLPPFLSCSSPSRVPVLVPIVWWPAPGCKVPVLGHKDPTLGCSHPQPLQQSGAATSPPACSYQHAPECSLQVKGNISLIAKPQKLAPQGLWDGEEETYSKWGVGKSTIHLSDSQKKSRGGKGTAQMANTGEKMQILLLEIKFLHSDLIQSKAYPKHLPCLSLRHTHVPNSNNLSGKAYNTVYKPITCAVPGSLEMQAITCPMNNNSKATRFHLMIFVIFKMCIIDRETVHKNINFHNIF